MKNKRKFWITKALGVAVGVSYLAAATSVVLLDIIPNKFLYVLIPLSFLIMGALTWANLKHRWTKKWKTTLLILVSLMAVILNIYVLAASLSTRSFLGDLQGCRDESYSLITKKASSTQTTSNNLSIAYTQTDPNNEAVLQMAKAKTTAEPKSYNDLKDVTSALNSLKTNSAVVRDSYLALLEQNDPNTYTNIKVLETFKVKSQSCKDSAKVNLNEPYIVYISGIDTYGNVEAVSRSDVNILMVVNPKTHKILLVNTPRDYYVQLHGTTGSKDKLTHAGIYGVDMSKSTLEDLYGVKIGYDLRINFTSLTKIIDALGGVNVNSDQAFQAGGYTFTEGYNEMDGKEALAFSRERYSFAEGDRTRGKNQQRVIEAIIAKSASPQTVLKYQSILKSLDNTFQTNASRDDITAILKQQADNVGKWQVESISVDGTGSTDVTYSMGDLPLYVMIPDQTSLDTAKAKIHSYLQK